MVITMIMIMIMIMRAPESSAKIYIFDLEIV